MNTDFFVLHEDDALLYFGNGITVINLTGAIDLLSVGSRCPSELQKSFVILASVEKNNTWYARVGWSAKKTTTKSRLG